MTSVHSRPVNAIVAIIFALAPLPALKLLDYLNQDCGDGLCGFFSGILVLGSLAAATAAFLFRSARRNETPSVLRFIPPALWVLACAPLLI